MGLCHSALYGSVDDMVLEELRILRGDRDWWMKGVKALKGVRDQLGEGYKKNKGFFTLGRYDLIKKLIQKAIDDSEQIIHDQKYRPVVIRTGGFPSDAADLQQLPKDLLRGGEQLFKDCLLSQYELEEKKRRIRGEILELKQDFQSEVELMKKLEKEYKKSKSKNKEKRYKKLQQLIKDITEE